MRARHAVALAGWALAGAPAPLAAQSSQVPVCPSLASAQRAQQAAQTPGTPLPDV